LFSLFYWYSTPTRTAGAQVRNFPPRSFFGHPKQRRVVRTSFRVVSSCLPQFRLLKSILFFWLIVVVILLLCLYKMTSKAVGDITYEDINKAGVLQYLNDAGELTVMLAPWFKNFVCGACKHVYERSSYGNHWMERKDANGTVISRCCARQDWDGFMNSIHQGQVVLIPKLVSSVYFVYLIDLVCSVWLVYPAHSTYVSHLSFLSFIEITVSCRVVAWSEFPFL
jgi:hypothetical protein